MKKVFSKTADVARAWAAQDQSEARTGSNTRFRDDTLYSYGTPIARIVAVDAGNPPIPGGGRVALISSAQWSSGTSKVQGEARAAASKSCSMSLFTVPALSGDDMHDRNIAFFEERIADALDKLQRGRPSSVASYRSTAYARIATASQYARTFGVTWSYSGPSPDMVLHPSEQSA